MKLTRNQIYIILLSALVFGAFYAMNHWAFIARDDYAYSVFFESEKSVPNYGCERVQTFWDCIVSQYHHYQVWNGRVIVHTLVQYFSGVLGRGWFNWVNTIVFLLFILGIARLTRTDRKLYSLNLFLCFVFSWFLLRDIADCAIWISGSINYLWASTLFVYFILYYPRLEQKSFPQWILPLLLLLGVFVGWTQEVPTISVCGGLFFTYSLVRRRWPNRQEWFFLIGFLIGIIGLCMAKGNVGRVENTGISFKRFFLEIAFIIKNGFFSWILLFVYLLCGVVKRNWSIEFLKRESLLIGTMLSVMFLSLLLQQRIARMYFFADSIAIILMVRWILVRIQYWNLSVRRLLGGILIVLLVVSFVVNVKGVMLQQKANEAFNRSILTNKGRIVERVKIHGASRFAISIELMDFADAAYCCYYGLEGRIRLEPPGLFEAIAPVDSFCVFQHQLYKGIPLYNAKNYDYFVLKIPKKKDEEIYLYLDVKLKERWDRTIRFRLGLLDSTVKMVVNRNFYDYSDGVYFYYLITKNCLEYAEKIVNVEVGYCD